VGRFAVTRGEFAAFADATNHKPDGGCVALIGSQWREQLDRSWRSPGFEQDDRHPAVCISWEDAKAFAAWLSVKTGRAYRLLTEGEWEYATRAGSNTRYSFGDDDGELPQYAWYGDNSGGRTHPVGEKKPNMFGLFDVHGNAWAWCQDAWHPTYAGAPSDGSAWLGDPSLRVLRGGTWHRTAPYLRSAFRLRIQPGLRYNDVGFRVARALVPAAP